MKKISKVEENRMLDTINGVIGKCAGGADPSQAVADLAVQMVFVQALGVIVPELPDNQALGFKHDLHFKPLKILWDRRENRNPAENAERPDPFPLPSRNTAGRIFCTVP